MKHSVPGVLAVILLTLLLSLSFVSMSGARASSILASSGNGYAYAGYGTVPVGSHGLRVLALRPAWAS